MLLPIMASADAIEIDGIYYNLTTNAAEVTSNPNKYTGSIVIPETVNYDNVTYIVTSIGHRAFEDCKGLTSVTIPNSVTSIGNYAFYYCSGLTSITIPNNVTIIGSYTFFYCTGLTSVTIPNSVTSIGSYAFGGCSSLTSITIPNNVTSINEYAYFGCSSLTSITIPNNVTSIGAFAFRFCSGLTSVTIPNSITSIGVAAFQYCSGLTSVTVLNPTPIAITEYVFTNRTNATLYVPKGSIEAYQAADYWKEFKEIIENNKCATPTILFVDGKLKFECDTEGVEFVYEITENGTGSEVKLGNTTTYHVSVYATKDGYENSEVATKDVTMSVGLKGDVNDDGKIDVEDVVGVVNIILDGNE